MAAPTGGPSKAKYVAFLAFLSTIVNLKTFKLLKLSKKYLVQHIL